MRYVWLVEGEPYAGTLQDYADALEQDAYSDLGVSNLVWYAAEAAAPQYARLVSTQPHVLEIVEHDDVRTVYIAVDGDEARYKIDLRS